MEKVVGILIIILILGALIYFGVNYISNSEFSLGNYFSPIFGGGTSKNPQAQEEIIGFFDNNDGFNRSAFYSDKKVNIFNIRISSDKETLFAGSDRGLFISQDKGLSWQSFSDSQNKISSNAQVYKILFNNTGFGFLSVFQDKKGFLYASNNNFSSLEKLLEFDNAAITDFDILGENLYFGLSDNRLFSYSLREKNLKFLKVFDSPVSRLKLNQSGLLYLTFQKNGLWLSGDFGQTFNQMKFPEDASQVYDFLIDSKNNFLIFAATDTGFFRSLDGGNNWQALKSLPSEKPIVSTLALRESAGEIFAVYGDKIYKSPDYGISWQILAPGFAKRIISVVSPVDKSIFIGTVAK
jgi:hypothetical protein